MRPEIAVAVAAFLDDRLGDVSAACRDLRVSRKTFYKYVNRFRAAGVDGFYPDSRRPATSPTQLPAAWEEVLVRLRKQEAEAGWDYGADAVLMRLEEHPELWPDDRALPSRATVNRVFTAYGQLAKVPQRRPRRVVRRFQRDRVNELWQFDGFDYVLADGTEVAVLQLIDDCSRVDLALDAAVSENGADVWATFCRAAARYGLPAAVLTDNGSAFSGRRRGWTSLFEQHLAALAIRALTSRVGHPQTCGKNERAHQRVQKWLARRPPARDLTELQAMLDEYRGAYNQRRNRVLDKLTPHQRFDLGPLAGPDGPLDPRTNLTRHIVSATGSIGLSGTLLGLGRKHAGKTATVFRTDAHAVVFVDDTFVRELTLDRTRRYQPQDG